MKPIDGDALAGRVQDMINSLFMSYGNEQVCTGLRIALSMIKNASQLKTVRREEETEWQES